jgi:hypothetical protein
MPILYREPGAPRGVGLGRIRLQHEGPYRHLILESSQDSGARISQRSRIRLPVYILNSSSEASDLILENRFSDYIVYVDESGDHGLESIDSNYPMFVLAFCVFRKDVYLRQCVPALQELKFRYFGHDMIVLHEREIRLARGPFSFLRDAGTRAIFLRDLSAVMKSADFTVIASAIHKERLRGRYAEPHSPYDLALTFCLERLHFYLEEMKGGTKAAHVVFECRGKREDDALELEFRRICDGDNRTGLSRLPFQPVFASKRSNSSGLQFADLVARPIGRHILFPDQENRAYDIIRPKIRQSGGIIRGRGLKVFP